VSRGRIAVVVAVASIVAAIVWWRSKGETTPPPGKKTSGAHAKRTPATTPSAPSTRVVPRDEAARLRRSLLRTRRAERDAGPACPPTTEPIPNPIDANAEPLACADKEGNRVGLWVAWGDVDEAEEEAGARALFNDGQLAYKEQRFDDAAEAFLDAYRMKPFAAFLYNAGVSYENGDPCSAVQYFTEYLETYPDGSDADSVADKVRALAAECTGG
jgi:tetratricopeptide (TPR) repeat protein